MKKTEAEQVPVTDAELDAALARMAEEAPPMPADFHARWMNAVRAEAGTAAPAEEPAPKHPLSLIRWTRILSVAAVFVFLIGGTLLYRNSKKSLTAAVPYAVKERDAADTVAEPTAKAPAGTETEEAEDRQALKAAGAAQNALSAAPKAEPAATESAAEEMDYAVDAAYEEEPVMGAAVYEAAEEASMSAPEEALTPAPTAEPTAVPTAEPTAAPIEKPDPEQAGFLPAAGAFFTDMGDFLLAALPYLLVLAVPAVTALVIRRRKSKKEN